MTSYILFQKKKYKIRQIKVNEDILNIGSSILSKKLFRETDYSSEEARMIDEQIYFFISPSSFGLSDEQLHNYLNTNCR